MQRRKTGHCDWHVCLREMGAPPYLWTVEEGDKYALRGVSSGKEEVHKAVSRLDKGLFPKAFCKILPDHAGGDPGFCNVMHADTAGTKTSLAYIYWRETGNLDVWRDIARDALFMNLDDLACVGILDNIIISSVIARNKTLIPGEVIEAIIDGTIRCMEELRTAGIHIHHAGGETADTGDIVRTADVGFTAFARIARNRLILNNIGPGMVITGLASYGQVSYETRYNGGMGSNGLTSARHDILSHYYAGLYPESFDPRLPEGVVYTGNKLLTDPVTVEGCETDIGRLILSPTRTYLPLLKALPDEIRGRIGGMIHCTGGGQTKVLHFIDNVHVIKDNMLPVPPLFALIQEESGTPWKEMYRVFNMGHRLEIYSDEETANEIIACARRFSMEAQVIGRVEASESRRLSIITGNGSFSY